jgi:hypothetical protein
MVATAAFGAPRAGATVIGTAHGIRYVRTTLNVASGSSWSDAINCGADYRPLSGGTYTSGYTDSRMTSSIVGSFQTNWTSAGWNPGVPKDVSTLALCRKTGAAVDYVSDTVPIAAGNAMNPTVKSANASCPAKTVVAGGGVQIPGNVSNIHVAGTYPVNAFGLWRVTVVNEGAARNFTVAADCVPAGLGLTYSKVTFSSVAASPAGQVSSAPCGPTKVPISGGAMWSGAQAEVHIASSGPINSSGNVSSIPDYSWEIAGGNDAGAPKDYTAFRICKPA